MKSKKKMILLGVGFLLVAVALPLTASSQMARAFVEKPKFEHLERKHGYELRKYPPAIAAQVTMPANTPDAMNKAFRVLADYIFGNNESQAKVAMTSPVIQEPKTSEKVAMTSPVLQEPAAANGGLDVEQKVQFIMPSSYTLETLPKPKDARVSLVERPARVYAVVRFTGVGKDEKMVEKEKELRESLQRDGIEVDGAAVFARYDPPWTFPLFRRNEVLIPVRYPKSAAPQ